MLTHRILVVDDDPKMLSLMRRGLSFDGYAVELAADGEEALRSARESAPDLVVLDVMLPGVDGVEVCRRLRAGDPDLPILMLTAKGRVPDRVAGLDSGADDYLAKPFAFEELLEVHRPEFMHMVLARMSSDGANKQLIKVDAITHLDVNRHG